MELLAEGSDEALGRLERSLSGGRGATPQRLETPKVVLGPDPKMGHVKSLGEGDIDRPRDPVITDTGEEWTPELQRRMNREMRMGHMRPARRKKDDGDGA